MRRVKLFGHFVRVCQFNLKTVSQQCTRFSGLTVLNRCSYSLTSNHLDLGGVRGGGVECQERRCDAKARAEGAQQKSKVRHDYSSRSPKAIIPGGSKMSLSRTVSMIDRRARPCPGHDGVDVQLRSPDERQRNPGFPHFASLMRATSPRAPAFSRERSLRIAATRLPQEEPTRMSRHASEPAPRLQVGRDAFRDIFELNARATRRRFEMARAKPTGGMTRAGYRP